MINVWIISLIYGIFFVLFFNNIIYVHIYTILHLDFNFLSIFIVVYLIVLIDINSLLNSIVGGHLSINASFIIDGFF